jgi:outer membrane protein OmpA-like peptidoglycan-associated protein
MKQKLTLIFLLFTSVLSVSAQKFPYSTKPALIGLHYTLVDYNSPTLIKNTSLKEVLRRGDIFNPKRQSSAFTVSFWKGLAKNIDLSAKFNGIFYDYALHNNPTGPQYNNEFGSELEGALNFKLFSDAHFLSPFITAGIGGGYYTNKLGEYVPVGLGLQLNFKNQVYVFIQNQFRFSLSKDIFPDNLLHSIGIAVNISKPKEVPPVEVPVVQITDRDNDGIVDSVDACPDQAGLAALQGCPDKDGDGIADREDSCADVAGTVKYHGCPIPDTDKDGINDEEDKCSTVAGVARYQGCPIPDTDGDGVNDEEDKCPKDVGPASNFGCPEIKQEIIKKVNLAAKNIFFATGSAKLLSKSYTSLNEVVKILTENPSFNVDVEGHTDITGTAEKNQVLSENRAASVKTYLVGKGVDESRITSKGYGQDKPIADNKTVAGRAKNRRVEMKLRNY